MHCIMKHKKFRFRKKVAGFDYDHAIVNPNLGRPLQKMWMIGCS